MSRVEKFGSRKLDGGNVRARGKAGAKPDAEGEQLPSRVEKYPSNRYKFTHWFYRFLIMLFIMLAVGLLLWGKRRYGL
ncbi:hypothetical protein FHS18_001301 [Paenibacillus phyllosphaerae]|uniref:Uncharacterized protein n=1 Tax=Paenibacillus phyllosphaerae TaxID=274593 RepID=A0A7W5AUY4_9BACL|nr:hypothetical protein [Paenibacillus phyllosphaerae]